MTIVQNNIEDVPSKGCVVMDVSGEGVRITIRSNGIERSIALTLSEDEAVYIASLLLRYERVRISEYGVGYPHYNKANVRCDFKTLDGSFYTKWIKMG